MKTNEFITSDTHFGHANVIKYCNRPFNSVEDMDAELIKRWNAKVPPGGTVYHLGDFALARSERVSSILNQLNGSIRLVRGNHDKFLKDAKLARRFEWVKDMYESTTDDHIKIVMCHYSILSWNKAHHGSWMLHGHSHGTLNETTVKRVDVGVDTHPNYEPYSFAEVERLMQQRSVKAVDHHSKDPK